MLFYQWLVKQVKASLASQPVHSFLWPSFPESKKQVTVEQRSSQKIKHGEKKKKKTKNNEIKLNTTAKKKQNQKEKVKRWKRRSVDPSSSRDVEFKKLLGPLQICLFFP